ncbi:MAG TPA: UDP-N-acetylmuramoyl-L-alanyl-D-glutamate--2,6-diaminopimelate ligase [Mariprofundaceae bacterium]|nr:UDP-N-acetylmuramoyl-L-alanyl-D-glutamate--2,6-diaminopimelate ligase [Mariprofundaceae bacterium]
MTDLHDIIPEPAPRTLGELANGLGKLAGEARICGIVDDSRRVESGFAFLCLPRAGTHAREYAEMAEKNGAAAIIQIGGAPLETRLPLLQLDSMQQAGRLLRRWHDTEQTQTQLIGVTGTDGKTSVTWMLREALERMAGKAWACGTLGLIRAADDIVDLGNTTPSLLNLHALLAAASHQRIPYLAMEVSSHGIAQERIAGLDFAAGIWTSIGHDHLQDHGGYEAYVAIKAAFLHRCANNAIAIANADHADIRNQAPEKTLWYGHGLYRSELSMAWEQELPGMLRLKSGKGEVRVEDVPAGEFHAENLACVALTLQQLCQTPLKKLPEILGGISAPPGRMQDLGAGLWQVFVDYAHTPEALERCLATARKLTRKQLLLVFGCGGERDRGKRPRMGAIAVEMADSVWITSDNPRSEQPEVIASEIEHGMPQPYPAEVHLQLDRERAIAEAIAELGPGDTLVIAGKGHENYMEIGRRRLPWSDAEVASRYLHDKNLQTERAACA